MSASRAPVTHHEIRFMAERLLAENNPRELGDAIRSLRAVERVYQLRDRARERGK